jgi:dTDP-4-amino-4,6-dideoxygalactose transaminase
VVVHYCGYPADMDPIMKIARKHKVRVIEDVSHAQGGLYKGRKVGTFGDAAAMSLMSGKSFAIGEAGMLVTNDRELYERCIAYGHYERTGGASMYNPADGQVTRQDLKEYKGIAMGGQKHRMNQLCSAMGRVQLKYYEQRMADIQEGMNYFWDLLEGVPGIRAHRPPKGSGSTMAGWYAARGLYKSEELGGLPCARFCEAVTAEGCGTAPGCNYPLHLHPLFHTADLFHMGKPTMVSFGQRDVRQGRGSLPVSERSTEIMYGIPWFKHKDEAVIKQYAKAFRKVAEHADELLAKARA